VIFVLGNVGVLSVTAAREIGFFMGMESLSIVSFALLSAAVVFLTGNEVFFTVSSLKATGVMVLNETGFIVSSCFFLKTGRRHSPG
jgi:hypothetical protein